MTKGIVPEQAPVSSQVAKAEQGDTKEQHQDQIASAQRDVLRQTAEYQKLSAKVSEAREKLPAFDKVSDLEGQLEVARKNLSMQESSSKEINDLKDERGKVFYELKSAKYDLSQLLIRFMAKYQQRSVNLRTSYNEIKVKAEVGKELDQQAVLPL